VRWLIAQIQEVLMVRIVVVLFQLHPGIFHRQD
jgi:hypothetical protein